MSDIFQEVQEEYRREQMAKIWAKYRVPLVAGVTVIVLAVAGFEGWRYWHSNKVDESSREFERVAELIASGAGKEKEAADRFAKLSATASSGYALAARFQEAGLRAELREFAAAVKIYDDISASTSDPLFRDYAQVRAAILLLEAQPFDAIKKRLDPIATSNSSPWRVIALEMLAYATWRAGKKDEALKLYKQVMDTPNAPNGSTRRAKEMTTLINAGMKLSDLNTKPGIATPGVTPLLLPPTEATQPDEPLLPDMTTEDPGLLGPATPEQPASPTPTP